MKKLIKFVFIAIFLVALHWNLSEIKECGRLPDEESFLENIQTIAGELPTKDETKTYIQENFSALQAFSETVIDYVENLENLLYD